MYQFWILTFFSIIACLFSVISLIIVLKFLFVKHCGPVKSWKRDQVLSNGTPRGFGFCEFESAEGLLRALRLLSKFNIDGQELVVGLVLFLFFFSFS